MIRYKDIFWIAVIALIILSIPTAESRKKAKKHSSTKRNDEIPIPTPPSEKITEASSWWKSAVCEFLGAKESDLDWQLVKEIYVEVGRWYLETFIDIPLQYITPVFREVAGKLGDLMTIAKENIKLEDINRGMDSVKIRLIGLWTTGINELSNTYNQIPEIDFKGIRKSISEMASVVTSIDFERMQNGFAGYRTWCTYELDGIFDNLFKRGRDFVIQGKQHLHMSALTRQWEIAKVKCRIYNKIYNTEINRAAAFLLVFYTAFTITLICLIRRTYRPHALCSSDITRALANEDTARKTCLYDFEVLRVLGGNTFCRLAIVARTDKATKRSTKFAVKIMSTNGIPRCSRLVSLLNPLNWILPNRLVNNGIRKELAALKYLISKPFSAGLAYAKRARNNVYFFLDIPQGNSFQTVLIKDGPFKPARLRLISAELVIAIQQMHASGMVCGEISPNTVILGGDHHVTLMTPGLLSLNIDSKWNLRGTTPVAVASSKVLDFHGDWYSLGLCILWLATGQEPDINENGKLAKSELSKIDDLFDEKLSSLIKDLLDAKSNKAGLQSHAYFDSIEWNRLAAKNIEMEPSSNAFVLEEQNGNESEYALVKDSKDDDIKEIVRYLEGIGSYKVKSL